MLAAERERIAALVEMLINILDQGDGDTDIETDCDFEADYAEQGIADLAALALYQKEAEERAAALEARLQADRRRMVANAFGPASAAKPPATGYHRRGGRIIAPPPSYPTQAGKIIKILYSENPGIARRRDKSGRIA